MKKELVGIWKVEAAVMSSPLILSLPLKLPNNSSKSPLLPPLSRHDLRRVARFYSLRQSTPFPNYRWRSCLCFHSGEESEHKGENREIMASFRFVSWVLVIVLLHGNGSIFSQAFPTHNPAYDAHYQVRNFNRSSFPRGFVFGSASAAYQVEGAWNLDGKAPSTWDVYTHEHPEKIGDHSSGDVAADSYHKYKEDVELLKKMNMDAYRFSISWPRILPTGKISGGVNEKGIEYYNKLIDHLVANGIKPAVTLFHWDTPQALEEEYGGFLSNKIAEDFSDFANLCFERFGDRVKFWITLNEPLTYVQQGYDIGRFAPHRCSSWRNNNCTAGDSATEPYMVMHNMLLAHSAAVKVYRTKYQADQKGVIGITLVASWMVPYSSSVVDKHATDRALDFQMGWNIAPVVYGEYPKSMRTLVGNRLPKFTKEESDSLKGSFNFLGLNYYAASYGKDASDVLVEHSSYSTDSLTASLADLNGMLIGEEAGSNWLHIYPRGIRKMLLYVKHKYKNPVIYITENGVDDKDDPSLPLETALKDRFRIKYYYDHLKYLRQAIHDGVKLRGFFAWALADNFEWADGYTVRFGLNYVDFKNPARPRYPKLSAEWFANFLSRSGTH